MPRYKKLDVNDFVACNNKRRRILALCHQLPESMGFSFEHPITGKRTINLKTLDNWLITKGPCNKPLNYHSGLELSRVITQFENMLKGYLKAV